MDLETNWNGYRESLEKLTHDELLESHMYEAKIRYHLEEILEKNGFRMNLVGE